MSQLLHRNLELESQVSILKGRLETLETQAMEARAGAYARTAQSGWHTEAAAILKAIEETKRGTFEEGLASIISYGLTTIFGDELAIKVKAETKRGVTNRELVIQDGDSETPILEYEGGSLVNALTMLLRVLLIVSSQPPMRRLLVLDEPFSMVSVEYRPALCQLLIELSSRLDIQFIIVSHEPEMLAAADKAYRVVKKKGKAVITDVTPERVQE